MNLVIAVVQNDMEVPAGTYAEHLEKRGVPFSLLKPCEGDELPPAAGFRAIIVLGGAMGVHDTAEHPFLDGVKRFIREAVEAHVPLLGICLGGQLLADVLGARVTSGACGEKGSLTVSLTPEGERDPLFAGVCRTFATFQWHNDTFAIPRGGVLLASSPVCTAQAFRAGETAYGLQFHPEVTAAIVDTWARWTPETAPEAGLFLAAFARAAEAYRAASERILANFLGIAGIPCPKNEGVA